MYQQVASTEISLKKVYSKNVFDTLNIIYMFLFICSQLKRGRRKGKKQNKTNLSTDSCAKT